MSTPGNERRVTILDTGDAYTGMSSGYQKVYFLRNKTISIKISGAAKVKLTGRVNGVAMDITPEINSNTLIQSDMMLDEIRALVTDYTDGDIQVSILGE